MRGIRSSLRTGALAIAVGALVTGALVLAPAGQAAAPSATPTITATTGPRGGDAIYHGQYRCSLGFNARNSAGAYYFLTSARCGGPVGTVIYANSTQSTVLGTTVAIGAPDYAIVKYAAGIVPPGSVDLYNGSSQDITTAADAFVGEAVKRSGSTTGVRRGSVTGVNVTVNYPEGPVSGLIKTTVCAEGGDSGGPLFDGTKALGVFSAGSGNCSTGGTTYYQPVSGPLAAYGLTVY